jgi:hypothetical protein
MHSFFSASALVAASRTGSFAPEENMEKLKFFTLPGLELRSLGIPARSQSLYRLRYRGSYFE